MSTAVPRQVDSAKKTCRIITLLQERGPVGVTELATELGISKSTVHGHLATLTDTGLVVKEDHAYRLSLEFLSTAESVKSWVANPDTVREQVRELAATTGEVVHFGAKEGDHVVYLEKGKGGSAVQTVSSVGDRMPLHSTSLGKAILGELPSAQVDEIVTETTFTERTPHTITDAETLHQELETTASRGYAIDDEENILGVRCIGTPVNVSGTGGIGALSISGPARRITDERISSELQDQLVQTANVIEVNSLYSSS